MKHLQRTLIGIFAIAIAHASAAELKYSVVPNFFDKAPDNQQLGPCHGGAVIDKAGNIYVTTDTARGIVVFSPEGKFVRAFGPVKIHGLEIREENGAEYIYAARGAEGEVLKMKLDGAVEWSMKTPMESGLYPDGKGFNPCAVTDRKSVV